MKELSDREELVLEACKEFIEVVGFSPSIRNIMDITEIDSTSLVRYYLKSLEAKGYIRRFETISRSIVILEKEAENAQ